MAGRVEANAQSQVGGVWHGRVGCVGARAGSGTAAVIDYEKTSLGWLLSHTGYEHSGRPGDVCAKRGTRHLHRCGLRDAENLGLLPRQGALSKGPVPLLYGSPRWQMRGPWVPTIPWAIAPDNRLTTASWGRVGTLLAKGESWVEGILPSLPTGRSRPVLALFQSNTAYNSVWQFQATLCLFHGQVHCRLLV